MSPTPSPNTVTSERAEDIASERTDFDLIDALSRSIHVYTSALYRPGPLIANDLQSEAAWEARGIAWADIEARFNDLRHASEQAQAKARHFEDHFRRLAREHPAADAALDTARREWAAKAMEGK